MAGKAVVINSSTGTGASVSFTSSSFGTPTGAIIFWSAATSSNADTAHARSAVTVWAGSNAGSVYAASVDNSAKTNTAYGIFSDVYCYTAGTLAIDFIGSISTTSDGITVSFSNSPDADYKVTVILFGGDAVCSAQAVDYGSLSDGGTYSYTGASAAPDVVFIGSSWQVGLNAHGDGRAFFSFGIGVNDGTQTQRSVFWHENDNYNDASPDTLTRNNAIALTHSSTNYLSLTSFTATGFVLTCTGSVNCTGIVLTISGLSDFSLNDTAMPAATGTTSFTGPGFAPDLVLSVQSGLPAYNTFYTTQDLNLTIGASDGTTTGGVAVYGTDGAATTDTANRHNTTLGTSNQTTAAEQWNYTLDSFDADGYNFNYTEVGTSGDIGFTLAMKW